MLRIALAAATLMTTAVAQLPLPFVPPQNPLTPEKAMLGKILFWDEQLSSDDSMACGTCHLPEFGGGDGRLHLSLNPGPDGFYGTADDIHGAGGVTRQSPTGEFVPSARFGLHLQVTNRASPSNLGSGHHNDLFWDGRASSQFDDPETGVMLIPFGGALESQAVGPILSSTEMAYEGRTWQDVRQKLAGAQPLALARNVPADMQSALQQNPTYPTLFTAAFGDPNITAARIGFALASYQRTLNPDDTPWDRYVGGQSGAMTAAEKQGWALFQNQAQCIACHAAPFFADDQFHNLGLRPALEDIGRGAFSPVIDDFAAFKTPTLRNAGLRPRLFHNGQSPALGDPAQLTDPRSTLNVYLQGGGVDHSNLSPFLTPIGTFGVTPADLLSVQDFVRTALTDPRTAMRLPPFDHPDLRSVVVAPPRHFGPALAGSNTPFLIDTLPTYPGNHDYRLGLAGGDGAGLGLLTYGFSSIEPSLTVQGLPWHLHVHDWLLFGMQGQPGQPGHATWRLPIPSNPALQPVGFYFQLFVLDSQAPTGIASSSGYEFFIR